MHPAALNAYREGRMNVPRIRECITSDGHPYTGEYEVEGDAVWFAVVDSDGREYQTREEPQPPSLFTMYRFEDGTPEAEVNRILDRAWAEARQKGTEGRV